MHKLLIVAGVLALLGCGREEATMSEPEQASAPAAAHRYGLDRAWPLAGLGEYPARGCRVACADDSEPSRERGGLLRTG